MVTAPQMKKRTQSRLRLNSSGQIAVEAILIIALSVGLFMVVSSQFREKQILANIISRPWLSVSAMIQNGVWQQGELHPVHRGRWNSVRGEDPR